MKFFGIQKFFENQQKKIGYRPGITIFELNNVGPNWYFNVNRAHFSNNWSYRHVINNIHSICKFFNPRSIPLSTPDAARSCQVTHVTSLLQRLQFKAISLRIIYLWCRMQRRAFIGMHLSGRCTPSYATGVRMVDSGITELL